MGVATPMMMPCPVSLLIQVTTYQGFHMRYHNHPNSEWLISHRPKRQTEKLPMPFYMSTSVAAQNRGEIINQPIPGETVLQIAQDGDHQFNILER